MAEKLKLDLIPVVFHGLGDSLSKGDFLVKKGTLTTQFLPRIKADDPAFGNDYSERTKKVTAYYRQEYLKMRDTIETAGYFRNKLIHNYKFRGSDLIMALRFRLKAEKNFNSLAAVFPQNGAIREYGCGYGFHTYMLSFTSRDSTIFASDPDPEKILVAENCFSKNERIEFICQSLEEATPEKADVFFLNDLGRYLNAEQSRAFAAKCFDQLEVNNVLVITQIGNQSDPGFNNKAADFFEGYKSKRFAAGFSHLKEAVAFFGESKAEIQWLNPQPGYEIIVIKRKNT